MLIEQRQQQEFRDLFDLCHRVDLQKINRRSLEALIFSGSLDGFGINRASLSEIWKLLYKQPIRNH